MFHLRQILTIAVALHFITTVHAQARPNIVFIIADDLGWTDLGCQGSKYYETPHIDKLATQGVRMSAFHMCQNCVPTRAAILSGQYPPRTGIYTVGSLERGRAEDRKLVPPENVTQLPLDRDTFADQMRKAGYATGLFGKWHVGETGEHHPGRRGFDEAIVSQGQHFKFKTNPKQNVPADVYLADWLTDRAVGFIEKNRDKPFFLYLAHFGVHSPYDAKKHLVERFQKKAGVGGHNNATYAAMIASVDESVGRVLAKLDELKLADNTVVIFTSDNGGVGGYAEIAGKGVTDNAPLRGGKGMLYAGGLRVPFLIRWTGGGVPPGQSRDLPVAHVDLFPTFLELGKAPRPRQTLDGESLVSVWKDGAAKLKRDAIFFHMPGYLEGYGTGKWRTTPAGGIQMGDWKLLEFFETGKKELYNLKDDLGEKHDLAAKMPEKVRELYARLVEWREEVKAAMPGSRAGTKEGAKKKKGVE